MISAAKKRQYGTEPPRRLFLRIFSGEPPFKAGKAYVLCGIALKQATPPVKEIL